MVEVAIHGVVCSLVFTVDHMCGRSKTFIGTRVSEFLLVLV
jgi:hypothetical protein